MVSCRCIVLAEKTSQFAFFGTKYVAFASNRAVHRLVNSPLDNTKKQALLPVEGVEIISTLLAVSVTISNILKCCHSFVDITGEPKPEISQIFFPRLTRSWLLPDASAVDINDDDGEAAAMNESSDEVVGFSNYDTDARPPDLEQT